MSASTVRYFLRLSVMVIPLICVFMPDSGSAAPNAREPLRTRAAPDGSGSANQLRALVAEAVQRSPLIAAARTRWLALTKVPSQSSTLPDPQFGLSQLSVGSPQPFSGYETSNFYYTGLGVSQEIPWPGKLRVRAARAKKEAEYALHGYEAEQCKVAEKVRELYYDLFYLTKISTVLASTREELEEIERTAEIQYRAGRGQQQDVIKAQLEATRVLGELETNREQVEQSQTELKAVMGREPDSGDVTIGEVEPSATQFDVRALNGLASARSPVLKMARTLEERSAESLELARKGFIPDFTAGYLFEKTGPGVRDYFVLTFGAKIPLYFWRKQKPALEQASLEQSTARTQSYASRLDVLSDVRRQSIAARATQRIMTLYREGLIPQALTARASALASYRTGRVDFQTLVNAVIAVLSLREQYYRAIADHEIALAKIRQILGDAS